MSLNIIAQVEQTASSYISAVVEIWFEDLVCDLLKAMTSPSLKPEAVLRRRSNCESATSSRTTQTVISP